MKNLSLFFTSIALLALPAHAAEYRCIPTAIDPYFESVPVFLLNIEESIDDSDEPIVVQTASLYRIKDNVEKEVFYGERAKNDRIARKNSAMKFQSDEESELYVSERLLSTQQGEILFFSSPKAGPRTVKRLVCNGT